MAFWFSPYNSSAEQQLHEASHRNAEEENEAKELANAVCKSFAARLANVNWSFENYEMNQTLSEIAQCWEYEEVLLAPGEQFLERVGYQMRHSKMPDERKVLIKKAAETVADDRFLKVLQMHFAYLRIISDDGQLICQFLTNRSKSRFLSITVKPAESINLVNLSINTVEPMKQPSRIWRLLKRK